MTELHDDLDPDLVKKAQTEGVQAPDKVVWAGQDCPAGNSGGREVEGQTKERLGGQHQAVDWP